MKNPKKIHVISKRVFKATFASFLIGSCFLANAQTQTLNDFSALPENLAGDIQANPNVLIILDNSGSMSRFRPVDNSGPDPFHVLDPETGLRYRDNATQWDGSSSFTNSYQVRSAMQAILGSDAYEGRLNVALMAFGQNRCVYDPIDNPAGNNTGTDLLYECFAPDGSIVDNPNGNRRRFGRGSNGLGQLRADFGNLTGPHKEKLLELLDFEPSPWNATNIGLSGGRPNVILPATIDNDETNDVANNTNHVNGEVHPFLDPNGDRTIDGSEDTILSPPDAAYSNFTPLSGSLESAFRYIYRNDIAAQNAAPSVLQNGLVAREIGLGNEITLDASGNPVTTSVQPVYLSQSQCLGPTIVILLTDGEPSQLAPTDLNFGIGAGTGNSAPSAINAAVAATNRIRYRGFDGPNAAVAASDEVPVYVIAFNLQDEDAARQIAVAGGTDDVISTSSTEEVEDAFASIFDDTLRESATRSGLSVVTTPGTATGSFVQPSFRPIAEDISGGTSAAVFWTGEVASHFIDRFGNFREDTNNNLELDDTDDGFQIRFNEPTNQTHVLRFDVAADGAVTNVRGEPLADGSSIPNLITVADLDPIFSASDRLNLIGNSTGQAQSNKAYTEFTSATGKRFIKTWVDTNASGGFDPGELKDLEWSGGTGVLDQINVNEGAVFDLPTANGGITESELIRFIRGQEIGEAQASRDGVFRKRRLNSTTKLLLGDIVHSTPVQVDGPILPNASSDDYAASFEDFRSEYEDRRKMIYVGANDGMLHAFNGGFWDVDSVAGTISIDLSPTGEVSHPLGDELWAFVPNAVLPQLKFLANPNYSADQHVSFVDGSLQAFDVKIFQPSATHPNGWGTILVAGMRFGGAEYTLDYNGDGDQTDANETFRSSYLIFDITDPESEPILLDEVNHPDLQLTTSKPTLFRTATNQAAERQHTLIFGSGPDNIENATRTNGSRASIFTYDLNNLRQGLQQQIIGGANTDSFVGDLRSVDWDQDNIDDAVYFGTISGTADNARGRLFRLSEVGNSFEIDLMINLNRPVQHEPVPQANQASQAEKYIVLGTSRTFTINDIRQEYNRRNILFGIRESFTSALGDTPVTYEQANNLATLNGGTILNVTNTSTSAILEDDEILGGQTRAAILEDFQNGVYEGWRLNLPQRASRLTARAAVIEELAFLTDFQPNDPIVGSETECSLTGGGFLNVIDVRTGLFASNERIIFDDVGTEDTDEGETRALDLRVSSSILAAGEILVTGVDANGNTQSVFKAPGSNQEITDIKFTLPPLATPLLNTGRKSWREIPLQ